MSLINRLQGTKSSSYREIKRKSPGPGSPRASLSGDNNIDGTSLFSGMTISSSTLSCQSDEGLLDSASSTSTNQLQYSQHVASDVEDLPAVLDTQQSNYSPDPVLQIPVIKPEGPSSGKKKIKKHGNIVRPGYARQSDNEQNRTGQQIDVKAFNIVEKEDTYVDVEPKPMTCTPSSESNTAHDVTHSTPLFCDTPHSIPLYSIGTPSSSDENLFGKDSLLEKETSSVICEANTEEPEDQYTAADEFQEINVQTQQVIGLYEMPLVQQEEETWDSIKIDELAICSDNSPATVTQTTQTTVCDTMIIDESTVESKEDEYVEIIEEAQKDTDPSKFYLPVISNLDQIQDITDPSSNGLDGNRRLGILLKHTELQLAALSENKKSLADIERELVKMYGRSSVAQLSTAQQIKELHLRENQALANDNYDLAEEISHQIEQLQQDLDSARYKIPANDTKVKEALKLREEIAGKEVEIYRENLASLQQVTEKQQASLVRHQAASADWNIKEKHLLNSERQRLERAMGHLKLDEEHLEKESSALHREIVLRTKEFHDRKEGLIKQKELLQEEISSLEMKLAELKLREEEFTYAIEQEENNIEITKTQFGPQQKMLDKQNLDIEGRQKTLNHEFELLASAQKKFDDEVEEQSLKEQELAEIFVVASDEIEKSAEVISSIEEQRRHMQQFLSMEHFTFETDPTLASLHTEQKEVSQEIKNLTDKVQQGQRGVTAIKKALNEIENQISELDAAKEIAKQKRNFREAKRLKEERDFLTKEGVKNQTQLESMLEELTDNQKLLEKARTKGEDLDLEINEYERTSALSKVEKASTVVQSLQHQIHRLRGDAVVTTLLEAEVEACKNLITDLCDKHDIFKPDVDGMQDISDGHNSADEETPPYNKETAKLTKEYEELINELNELEGRLEAVVDVEDFNEAERLQQEIEKLNERIKRVAPV